MTYDYSYDYSGDLEELLDNFFYGLEEFFYDFDPALIFGIVLIPFLIFAVSLLIGYIIRGIAVSGLAKKFGKTNGGLAWVPFFQDIFCTAVISELTAKPYFSIHPKIDKTIKLHDRKTAFYAYLGCAVVLPLIVTGFSYVIGFVFGLIPVIGVFIAGFLSFLLGLIPTVIIAAFKFAYLRDVLDALKRDKDDNQRMALIITIVNHFVPIVEPVYLLSLRKYTPLDPQEYCDPYAFGGNPYGAPYGNPYAAPYGNPYAAPGYPPYGNPCNNPYNNPYNAPEGNPVNTDGTPENGNSNTSPESAENAASAQPDTASCKPCEEQPVPDNAQSSAYNAQQNNQGNAQWQTPPYPPYGALYPPYGTPGQPPYGTPNQSPFGTPNQSPFGAPNQPPFGTPGQAPFGASGQPPFGSPPPYGTPGAAPYGAPGNPPYGAPFNNPPSPPDPTAP